MLEQLLDSRLQSGAGGPLPELLPTWLMSRLGVHPKDAAALVKAIATDLVCTNPDRANAWPLLWIWRVATGTGPAHIGSPAGAQGPEFAPETFDIVVEATAHLCRLSMHSGQGCGPVLFLRPPSKASDSYAPSLVSLSVASGVILQLLRSSAAFNMSHLHAACAELGVVFRGWSRLGRMNLVQRVLAGRSGVAGAVGARPEDSAFDEGSLTSDDATIRADVLLGAIVSAYLDERATLQALLDRLEAQRAERVAEAVVPAAAQAAEHVLRGVGGLVHALGDPSPADPAGPATQGAGDRARQCFAAVVGAVERAVGTHPSASLAASRALVGVVGGAIDVWDSRVREAQSSAAEARAAEARADDALRSARAEHAAATDEWREQAAGMKAASAELQSSNAALEERVTALTSRAEDAETKLRAARDEAARLAEEVREEREALAAASSEAQRLEAEKAAKHGGLVASRTKTAVVGARMLAAQRKAAIADLETQRARREAESAKADAETATQAAASALLQESSRAERAEAAAEAARHKLSAELQAAEERRAADAHRANKLLESEREALRLAEARLEAAEQQARETATRAADSLREQTHRAGEQLQATRDEADRSLEAAERRHRHELRQTQSEAIALLRASRTLHGHSRARRRCDTQARAAEACVAPGVAGRSPQGGDRFAPAGQVGPVVVTARQSSQPAQEVGRLRLRGSPHTAALGGAARRLGIYGALTPSDRVRGPGSVQSQRLERHRHSTGSFQSSLSSRLRSGTPSSFHASDSVASLFGDGEGSPHSTVAAAGLGEAADLRVRDSGNAGRLVDGGVSAPSQDVPRRPDTAAGDSPSDEVLRIADELLGAIAESKADAAGLGGSKGPPSRPSGGSE